jgi:ABC-type xylose transport system substrate-binding protein
MADTQDWTPVVLKKTRKVADAAAHRSGATKIVERPAGTEAQRLASLEKKIENNEAIIRKHIDSTTLKSLIQTRIEKKLTQINTDNLCGFPRNTFREIESGRLIPNSKQISLIQKSLGVVIRLSV